MQTADLRDCMLRNKEYYAPVLEEEEGFAAEKAQAAGREAAVTGVVHSFLYIVQSRRLLPCSSLVCHLSNLYAVMQ